MGKAIEVDWDEDPRAPDPKGENADGEMVLSTDRVMVDTDLSTKDEVEKVFKTLMWYFKQFTKDAAGGTLDLEDDGKLKLGRVSEFAKLINLTALSLQKLGHDSKGKNSELWEEQQRQLDMIKGIADEKN